MLVIVAALVLIIIAMMLLLWRALLGPSVYDRMLAANSFGAKTIALILLLAIGWDEPMLLDIALVYVMVNFVTTIGILKYVKYRSLGAE